VVLIFLAVVISTSLEPLRLPLRPLTSLAILEAGVAVKDNVYLRKNTIELNFQSKDRSRVELAARLLKLAGVNAEVKKEGGRDVWYVKATTDKLAAGREELRKALAEIVREAVTKGWIDAGKAEGWLKELERGNVLKEGWPRYEVGLAKGAPVVIFSSTNPRNIEQEIQRLREMGLKGGVHFSVKMPGEGRDGYVHILKEGLAYAAWLSEYGEGGQQRLAAEFVEYILERAEEEGEDVYRKAEEIVKEGKARDSLTLKGFEGRVEMNGKTYVVKVRDGEAVEEDRGGKKLLRIKITAEVDGVKSEYTITFSRRGRNNAIVGFAVARAEADAERLAAVVEALTGKRPRVYRMKDGTIIIECGREHLDNFKRFAELAGAVERWLKETGS
jgi:hypothetical protein